MGPLVSIVMPTYNRRDSILRSIESVRAQWHEDWELLVVDDGSTDGTGEMLEGLDQRIRLICQKNAGVHAARNTGLAGARGELVAFLDSDDTWHEWHLPLAVAFFRSHSGEHVYADEVWQDFGDGLVQRHFHTSIAEWNPKMARRISSKEYSGRPPLDDPYLWVYGTREDPGSWTQDLVERTGFRDVFLYQGSVFSHWRWGYLGGLQPTVLTRRAVEVNGPFDTRFRSASDFPYLVRLYRQFNANLLSIPGTTKHERGPLGARLAQDHLARAVNPLPFQRSFLVHLEEFYARNFEATPELRALLAWQRILVAQAALEAGERELALASARQALPDWPGGEAKMITRILSAVPGVSVPRAAWRAHNWVRELPERVHRRLRRLGRNAS